MIVRRPSSPVKFTGTILMEWQNVTEGYDLDADGVSESEHYIRRGYAWVAFPSSVSVQ
jgi:hypothetical protein